MKKKVFFTCVFALDTTPFLAPGLPGSALCPNEDDDIGPLDSSGYPMLLVGHALAGMSNIPTTTLVPAFLDRFVGRDELAFYLGIINAVGIGKI